MADQETVVEGQDTVVANDAPSETVVSDEGQQVAEPKLFFGKYKTEGEAEKAYKESERKISEEAEKASKLQRELDSLRERSQFADVLSKLSEKVNQEKKPEVDFDRFAEELGDAMTESPKEATKKLMRTIGSWTASDRDSLLKEIKSLREDVAKVRGDVTERIETADPFYTEHKELIDEMRKEGMSLAGAKAFLRKFAKNDEQPASGGKAPTSVTGGARSASAGGSSSYLSAAEKAELKADGYTDADIAEMENTQKRNVAREKALRKEENA